MHPVLTEGMLTANFYYETFHNTLTRLHSVVIEGEIAVIFPFFVSLNLFL